MNECASETTPILQSPLLVAFHEAGHAVVAYLLGLNVKSASIISEDDSYGHLLYENPMLQVSFEYLEEKDIDKLKKRIKVSLAGEYSQEKIAKDKQIQTDPSWSKDDWQDAIHVIALIAGDEESIQKEIDDIQQWLLQVFSRKNVWNTTREVAEKLMLHKTIDEKELLKIFKKNITKRCRKTP